MIISTKFRRSKSKFKSTQKKKKQKNRISVILKTKYGIVDQNQNQNILKPIFKMKIVTEKNVKPVIEIEIKTRIYFSVSSPA